MFFGHEYVGTKPHQIDQLDHSGIRKYNKRLIHVLNNFTYKRFIYFNSVTSLKCLKKMYALHDQIYPFPYIILIL